MLRRLVSLLAATVLAGSALLTTAVPVVSAAGPCNGNTLGSGTVQMYIEKYVHQAAGFGDYFDGVRGDATIRNLDQCIGTSGQGGTFVLPANVQNDYPEAIFQVGYGELPGYSSVWVWADRVPDMKIKSSTACPPINGHRVTFRLNRNDVTDTANYTIEDQTAGCGISWTGTGYWSGGQDHAWWGYESFENASGLGPVFGEEADVNMAYMGYSVDTVSGWTWRSDLRQEIGTCPSCIHFTNNTPQPVSAHLGDWVFNNDKFNVHTHR